MILNNQRNLFDIPADVAYLNCAYMSPLLRTSIKTTHSSFQRKARPWNITPEDFFSDTETTRRLAAKIVGCSSNDIALVPSASYGIAIAERNLLATEGQEILVLDEQYPSNLYAWREMSSRTGARLRTIPRPHDGNWTPEILRWITAETALAALPHCHWKDGSLVDLEIISELLRKHGASLVVDATQSLGAMPLNLERVQPDFLVAACYKWLLGPYSTGILYVAPQHQEGQPLEFNSHNRAGSEDFTKLVRYRDDYQEGARRFDVGERSNFALLPPLIDGLKQILDWGIDSIYATIGEITHRLAEEVERAGLIVDNPAYRANHFLGIRFPGDTPIDLTDHLAKHNIYVSRRGNSVRVTPHVYNTNDDIERLLKFLGPYLS